MLTNWSIYEITGEIVREKKFIVATVEHTITTTTTTAHDDMSKYSDDNYNYDNQSCNIIQSQSEF